MSESSVSELLNFQYPLPLKSDLAQDEIFRTIEEWSLCIGERNLHNLTSNCRLFEIRKKSRCLNPERLRVILTPPQVSF